MAYAGTMADDLSELITALGFDGYRAGPVLHRIRRHMETLGVVDVAALGAYLDGRPERLAELRAAVPIEHTGFFRDPADWTRLEKDLVPKLVKQGAPIRIWSAGCSTGEEPYSLAMLFAEAIGLDELARRVTIFASDISEERLAHARSGEYLERRLVDIPTTLRRKYFDSEPAVRDRLRRAIRFSRHDLVSDPPFMHIDLLVCRNVMLYFVPEARKRVLAKLWFALAEKGDLFTGPADGMPLHRNLFRPTARHFHVRRHPAKREVLIEAGKRAVSAR